MTQAAAAFPSRRKNHLVFDLMESAIQSELAARGIDAASAQEISYVCALKVCQAFGGDEIYFPKMDSFPREYSAARILEAWRSGLSIDQIAEKTGYTNRYVRILLNEGRQVGVARLNADFVSRVIEKPNPEKS